MGLLRFLLALSVVLAHAPVRILFPGQPLVGGALAVQIFFMISGFYMALILDGKYSDNKLFWSNRALRLLPAYFLCLLLALLVDVTLEHHIMHHVDDYGVLTTAWVALSSLLILGRDVALFFSVADGHFIFVPDFRQVAPQLCQLFLLPQAWTLALEFYFYLLAPFLLRLRSRWLLIIFITSLTARVLAMKAGYTHDPWTHRFFPFELALFLAGALAYRFYKIYGPLLKTFPFWSVYAALPLALFFYPLWSSSMPPAIATWVMLNACFLLLPFLFAHANKNKWDRFLGELSYPLYLNHLIILALLNHSTWLQDHARIKTALLLLLSTGFAAVIYLVLERPIDIYRDRRVIRAQTAAQNKNQ